MPLSVLAKSKRSPSCVSIRPVGIVGALEDDVAKTPFTKRRKSLGPNTKPILYPPETFSAPLVRYTWAYAPESTMTNTSPVVESRYRLIISEFDPFDIDVMYLNVPTMLA